MTAMSGAREAGTGAGDSAASTPPAAAAASADDDETQRLLHARYGYTGFAHASVFSKITYLFVSPLLRLGARNKVGAGAAAAVAAVRWLLAGTCWLRALHSRVLDGAPTMPPRPRRADRGGHGAGLPAGLRHRTHGQPAV